MIKILSDDLKVYFDTLFPYQNTSLKVLQKIKPHAVTIGIGGNIGNVKKRFKQLFLMLRNDARFTVECSSPILKNPPFGYLSQDDFLNAIIILKTNLSPIECLNVFQRYEYRFKRTRSFQDAPRTLDIDIIFYDKRKIDTKRLTIPHKGYKHRESVLIPLSYISKLKYGKIKNG
ncbi:MAG: 2-amino-4-hydroxy-6-hydroxymethyldihydropteridine diphosphokinase [Arcobacteraceae bacterium]